jgi:hypothetical protein
MIAKLEKSIRLYTINKKLAAISKIEEVCFALQLNCYLKLFLDWSCS